MPTVILIGLICSTFSILSIYPAFNDPNNILALLYAILSLIFFFSYCLKNNSGFVASLLKAIYTFILTGLCECIGFWVYITLFSQKREFPILSSIFSFLLSIFRVSHGIGSGKLYLHGTAEYVYSFSPNSGNLGLLYFLMLSFGLISLLSLFKPIKKTLTLVVISIISLFFYLFLRTTTLVFIFLTQNVSISNDTWFPLSIFWHPVTTFLSFLPWILIAHLFTRGGKLTSHVIDLWTVKKLKEQVLTALSLGFCIFFLILFIFWVPSGTAKQGRVLFEEHYSDWSKSTKPIDEYWYNIASTYNYYTLRTFLNSYYEVAVNECPLEEVDLTKVDVILIKMPTKPYSEAVIEKLVHYVKSGGGIWVIGDHTNLFGSATYLNALLEHFGIVLRYDSIYHNVHSGFNKFSERQFIRHPIMQRVPVFLFANPCSIQIKNPSIRTIIPGLSTKAYQVQYYNKNFFPDTKADLNVIYGPNTLMAAGSFGKGRVVVFTDSTVFSNFYMYLPGKPELAFATVTWLNHKQSYLWIKPLTLVLAILFFFMFIIFYFRKKISERNLFWPVLFSVFFLTISLFTVNALNKNSISMPEEKRPLTKVSFIGRYSNIYLPFEEQKKNEENNFNTFYIWAQRVGLRTEYLETLDDNIDKSSALFIILPNKEFEKKDLNRVDFYLKEGGKVFILDNGNTESTANELLSYYGLSLTYEHNGRGQIRGVLKEGVFDFNNNLPIGLIEGDCNSLMVWQGKNGKKGNVFIQKSIGKGELYVFGGIFNFSNDNFGDFGIVPSGEKKTINELILEIYRLSL